jgi:hypothetical protein
LAAHLGSPVEGNKRAHASCAADASKVASKGETIADFLVRIKQTASCEARGISAGTLMAHSLREST